MSRSLNKVLLIGHLGKDAETRHTPSGIAVTNFSIATSRRYKKGDDWVEETDWHDIVLWRGDNVAPYLLKGTQVHLEGRLQTRSWEDDGGNKKYRTEVVVDMGGLILLGGGSGEGKSNARPPVAQRNDSAGAISDDDVPF